MHDKKSDHYTSAKNYTDLDGQSKSFTFIDHDVKTKINVPSQGSRFEAECKELRSFIESRQDDPNYGLYVDELKEEYGYECFGLLLSLAKKLGYEGDIGL